MWAVRSTTPDSGPVCPELAVAPTLHVQSACAVGMVLLSVAQRVILIEDREHKVHVEHLLLAVCVSSLVGS